MKNIVFAAFAAFAVVSAYAQDDEVTSFEDFDEPVAESNATAAPNAGISEVNAAGVSASSEDVTKLDLLSVETESEAEHEQERFQGD